MPFLITALAMLQAPASTAAPQPAPQAAAAEPKQICRRVGTTGTRLPGKRECHTAAEWKAIAQQAGTGMNGFNGTQMRNQ